MHCPTCHEHTLERTTADDSITVAGHTFTASLPAHACPGAKCDEIVFDAASIQRFELVVARALADAGQQSGEAFRFMRKSLGLRAIDLAELLGVAAETISRWETGERDVDRVAFALLGDAVAEQLEGRTRALDFLRALSKPKRLAKAVRVEVGATDVAE
jgi:putative zinc finger/helix-turn-helix YgiT family protein